MEPLLSAEDWKGRWPSSVELGRTSGRWISFCFLNRLSTNPPVSAPPLPPHFQVYLVVEIPGTFGDFSKCKSGWVLAFPVLVQDSVFLTSAKLVTTYPMLSSFQNFVVVVCSPTLFVLIALWFKKIHLLWFLWSFEKKHRQIHVASPPSLSEPLRSAWFCQFCWFLLLFSLSIIQVYTALYLKISTAT